MSKRWAVSAIASGENCAETEPIVTPSDRLASMAGAVAGDGPRTVQPGDRLGDYRILDKLGEGGMGVVYKAHDQILQRTVALKLLSPQLISDREFLERFRAEARIQARLTGRNIVTLHSLFQAPPGLVLVMEYVEGETLAEYLQRRGRLRLDQALRVFGQALRGVERAHRLGVIHCDLKPGNIFLTREGEIKLMDFGLARLVGGDRIAARGAVLGTLRYIAPEQIQRRGADLRSDLYALGISLYEAVTGRPPFDADCERELLLAHLEKPAPPPTAIAADLPIELDAIVLKAIEKDPARRYQNAREFHTALQALGEERVQPAQRAAPLARRRPLTPLFGIAGTTPAHDGASPTVASVPFTYTRSRHSEDLSADRPALRRRRGRLGWLAQAFGLYLVLPALLIALMVWGLAPKSADGQDPATPLHATLNNWLDHFRAGLSPYLPRQLVESEPTTLPGADRGTERY